MSVSVALPGDVSVFSDGAAVANAAAEWIANHSRESIATRGSFSIALAGGSTPKATYELLAKKNVDWSKCLVFFGDERAVAPTDPESNYAMAKSALFDPAQVPDSQVFRMHAEHKDLKAAAAAYSEVLGTAVGDASSVPILDCVLLGLGENGHTASLFPGDQSLRETDSWCTPGRADYQPYDRLTLTFPAINAARHVVFIVSGANKHTALTDVVRGSAPAAQVRPDPGQLHWFLDAAADG